MSSETKDPLDKQDTSSGSSESPSDGEVEKAEENLEHLKIEERLVKEDADESKPLDSTNQEEDLESQSYLFDDQIPGPSGLQKPLVKSSEPKRKDVGKMGGDSDTTDTTSSSSSSVPKPKVRAPSAIPGRLRGQKSYEMDSEMSSPIYHGLPSSLVSKRESYRRKHDSANTSADISEIHSEVADLSTDESVYREAAENLDKESSPSVYEPAVERQISEDSDTSMSDLQDESVPLPTPSDSSISISTNTGDEGHQAYLAMLQREADQRGVQPSTSSGIGSTNQSELGHLQRWADGERGYYRPNLEDIIDSPNQEFPAFGAQGEDPQRAAESQQDEPRDIYDRLFQQAQKNEEANMAKDVVEKNEARRMKLAEASNVGKGSPSVRRKSSKCVSDSSSTGNVVYKLRPLIKPGVEKKGKVVASKSSGTRSSSEPKSSSSDELHRKDSPDIKSSSGSQDPSQSEMGKKSWQKYGQLRTMQLSTISSQGSVITEEEEDQLSPVRSQNPESMEGKEISPEKMETTPEKDATRTEPTESRPSAPEFSDQAHGSETDATLKEQESSLEGSEFERSVGQSKRPGGKLSSSPPSDERLSSTPPKGATYRPKKKARADKKHAKGRRTRTDSGGSLKTNVGLDRLKREDSSNTPDPSDYTGSEDDEQETQL